MTHPRYSKPPAQVALLIACLASAVFWTTPVRAQETGSTVSVSQIELSHDTVGIGDIVDLSFVVEMPPDIIAFLPDSLDASDFESFEPVHWSAEPGPAGGTRLTVTYPLMAFQVGGIAVPEFPIFVARGSESVSAGFASEGDLVGSWSDFRAEPAATPSARMLLIPPQPLWVASVLEIEDASNGVQPRPVADVVGGGRHWPATILVVLFAVLLAWLVGSSGYAAWVHIQNRPAPPEDPRVAALAAFDDLLAEGVDGVGDVRSFYSRASDITRRFVEVLDQRWGPAQTSTELMSDLETATHRSDFTSVPEVEPLAGVMGHAEEVKFGGDRPDPATAAREVEAARSWIERTESG